VIVPVQYRAGHLGFGAPMKFTLTYDGRLPPSANKPKVKAVWEIRKAFHPQMVDLWSSHPGLLVAEAERWFPKSGGFQIVGHHSQPQPVPHRNTQTSVDLCETITKYGRQFRPLVRESHLLHCGLKISFLRKEPPGRVYQGGDLDGRIKTLLDALAMPENKEQVRKDALAPDLTYCLLEDDSLVSGIQVESERLLTDQDHPKDYVRVNIEVDVRVRYATVYNQSFLG
jgi:hypothetical protein